MSQGRACDATHQGTTLPDAAPTGKRSAKARPRRVAGAYDGAVAILIDDARWAAFCEKQDAIAREQQRLRSTWVHPDRVDMNAVTQVLGKPIDPAALEVLGDAQVKLGKPAEAQASYRQALRTLEEGSPERQVVELKLADVGGSTQAP